MMSTADESREEILSRFVPRDVSEEQALSMGQVRMQCQSLAVLLLDLVPPGRERRKALEHLEEVSSWAIKGISHSSGSGDRLTGQ